MRGLQNTTSRGIPITGHTTSRIQHTMAVFRPESEVLLATSVFIFSLYAIKRVFIDDAGVALSE